MALPEVPALEGKTGQVEILDRVPRGDPLRQFRGAGRRIGNVVRTDGLPGKDSGGADWRSAAFKGKHGM